MNTYKVIIACKDSNDSPDFYFVKVKCTEKDVIHENHFKAAKKEAVKDGYNLPMIFFDEYNAYNFGNMHDWFVWKTATTVTIDK